MRVAFEACHGDAHIRLSRRLGRRCAGPIIRRRPRARQLFISWHAGRTSAGFGRSLATRKFLVQIADAPLLQNGLPVVEPPLPVIFPGQGDLPINDFMKGLLSTGMMACSRLEIFNDQFRAGSAVAWRSTDTGRLSTYFRSLAAGGPARPKLQPCFRARSALPPERSLSIRD